MHAKTVVDAVMSLQPTSGHPAAKVRSSCADGVSPQAPLLSASWPELSCSGSLLSTEQPGSTGNIVPWHPGRGRSVWVNLSIFNPLTGSCYRAPYRELW